MDCPNCKKELDEHNGIQLTICAAKYYLIKEAKNGNNN